MEFKINEYQLPAPITFNYEELKAVLIQKADAYACMVYTEDQIKEAKADRANLNRLKKALNDERLKREKDYMQPFNTFKAQVNEIISIIDKPCAVIDNQVKEFEEKQKAEKMDQIDSFFCEQWNSRNFPAAVEIDMIMDHKWLNASVSMKSIQEAIIAKLDQVEKDLAVIRSLPSYAFEAEQMYLQTLDLARAVSEAHRLQEMAEKKAAYEAENAERIAAAKARAENFQKADDPDLLAEVEEIHKKYEPSRQWIGFQAFLSVDEAKALGQWLKAHDIKYKAI